MTSSTPRHRDLLLIAGYVGVVLLLAAIFSPPVFFAARQWIEAAPDGLVAEVLGHRAFPAYFNRVGLAAALIGLWPLFTMMRMTRPEVLGENAGHDRLSHFTMGFLLASILLLVMGAVFVQLDAYRMKPEPRWLDLMDPMVSALAVSFIEEFLFRGAILGILCRSLGLRSGLWWTTMIFALVHFLKPPADEAVAHADVTWTTGFWVLSQLFRGFADVEHVLEEFMTLAAVGFVLGLMRLRTGALWASIGLHAGWVFGLKYFGGLKNNTRRLKEGEWAPWIGENLKIGLVPFAVVLLTGALLLWWHQARRQPGKKDIARTGG